MLNMLKFFLILTAMITAIVVGSYAIFYALLHAWIYVAIFTVGLIGLAFGLFSLHTISENLK